jgi:hypothetical protein
LRWSLAIAIGLGLSAPAEAQLWKPNQKASTKKVRAQTAPTPRKASTPGKREPSEKTGRSARRERRVDNNPVITISDGD